MVVVVVVVIKRGNPRQCGLTTRVVSQKLVFCHEFLHLHEFVVPMHDFLWNKLGLLSLGKASSKSAAPTHPVRSANATTPVEKTSTGNYQRRGCLSLSELVKERKV